jgi:hypothetical protein
MNKDTMMRMIMRALLIALLCVMILPACAVHRTGSWMTRAERAPYDTTPKRLMTQSPWFYVAEEDVDLQVSYSGFDPDKRERFSELDIAPKALEMIQNANKVVIASIFLFDTLYSDDEIKWDVVADFTDLLVQKKKENPNITVALILDPVNRAYGKRISSSMDAMLKAGIDIFISDLLATKSATALPLRESIHHVGRFLNKTLTFGLLGDVGDLVADRNVPIQTPLGQGVSINKLWNALALKANHRKVLVVDSGDTYELMVTSANPHNASIPNSNYGTTVRGDLAKYVYMVLREDAKHSIELDLAIWHYEEDRKIRKEYGRQYLRGHLPHFDLKDIQPGQNSKETPVAVSFMTESLIRDQIIAMLSEVESDDEVRIQMFYLSNIPVIQAIMDASKIVGRPVRIILDPNKDAFNIEKDGTPNRQVAYYLMEERIEQGLNLEIRWYDTHGEQNHAKIMSITNPAKGKYEIINGSANWTKKNLEDINMEANIRIVGSEKVTRKFNAIFDLLWTNENDGGMVYTLGYHDQSTVDGKRYNTHTGMSRWYFGEKTGYVGW